MLRGMGPMAKSGVGCLALAPVMWEIGHSLADTPATRTCGVARGAEHLRIHPAGVSATHRPILRGMGAMVKSEARCLAVAPARWGIGH